MSRSHAPDARRITHEGARDENQWHSLPGPVRTRAAWSSAEETMRIAIIGAGCRFPGGASHPAAYWDLLSRGGDAVIPVPPTRWDQRKFSSIGEKCDPGKTLLREGGFLLENLFEFDPMFFGISPREAETMDPQQRMLLEVAFEGIDGAGLRLEDLRGKAVGVFVGAFALDNMVFQARTQNRKAIESTNMMGFSMTLLANRLSHAFDWTGPSLAIDTACSSSLVAVHEACESLRRGESEIAIAGGVNAILGPDSSTAMSRGGVLSPTCRCRTFDDNADGYVRGEGAGIVILKPLESALADGDPVRAVIRGSGVNQDGHTRGIAFPNSRAQENLLRETYEKSGIDPRDIAFLEAHGTGTKAGDLAEIESISSVFQPGPDHPLPIGSVKTNLGHLEAAAGIAGLIKALLCLEHRQFPPHLHLEQPNPALRLDERGLLCPRKLMELDREAPRLFAGVNSFGYGGTNAHVILESAVKESLVPASVPVTTKKESDRLALACLSAHSAAALRDMAGRNATWLEEHPDHLADWRYTLRHHRSRHRLSLTVPATSSKEAIHALNEFSRTGKPGPGSTLGPSGQDREEIVFVCTGMGPQWWGMAHVLYRESAIFRGRIDRCDEIFREIAGWSIREELLADESASRMSETSISQPANFCLQVGLAALWKSLGIEASAIVGHSVGEVSAAHLAGALSLEDALLVCYHRSRLQQTLAGTGCLLAVGMGERDIRSRLEPFPSIAIAAVNSPVAVTLAGSTEDLADLAKRLESEEIFARLLEVEVPYHSPGQDPIRAELLDSLSDLEPAPTRIPLFSTVSGEKIDGEHLQAGYWWNNARRTVSFESAIEGLLSAGFRTFLELGPNPVLSRSLREIADAARTEISILASLRRDESERNQLMETRGRLAFLGHALPPESEGRRISLPSFPWQKSLLWRETSESSEDLRGRPDGHVFLQVSGNGPDLAWETEPNPHYFPWMADHRVRDAIVWPGAGYVEAGLALNLECNGGAPATLENLRFHRLLEIPPDHRLRLATSIDPNTGRWIVRSSDGGEKPEWTLHAEGILLSQPEQPESRIDTLFEEFRARCHEPVDLRDFYHLLQQMGLDYGESFRRIDRLSRGESELFAEVSRHPGDGLERDHYQIHPTLLDAAFQAFATLLPHAERDPWIPTGVRRLHFQAPAGDRLFAGIRLESPDSERVLGRIFLWKETGERVAVLEDVEFRRLPRGFGRSRHLFHHPAWDKSPLLEGQKTTRLWNDVLFCVESGSPAEDLLGELLDQAPGTHRTLRWKKEGADEIAARWRDCEAEGPPAQVVFLPSCECSAVSESDLSALVELIRTPGLLRTGAPHPPVLTVVTTNLFADRAPVSLSCAPIWGFVPVLANEHPDVPVRLVDVSTPGEPESLNALIEELGTDVSENEIRIANGVRETRSWTSIPDPLETTSTETIPVPDSGKELVRLKPDPGKGLSGLRHVRDSRTSPGEGEIVIRTSHTGLNFKDLLKASGQIVPAITEGTFFGSSLGLECSGTVEEVGPGVTRLSVGDRVAAFAREGCFASHVRTGEDLAVKLPEGKPIEDACCLIPWVTAWHCLVDLACLSEGETVLIHSAAGGLGIAAVRIALARRAAVFATAGTPEKRAFLEEMGVAHVSNSRELFFADEIREATAGRGVDVVLNSLPGEILRVSFRLLAPYGRFIEVGKRDIVEDRGLPMEPFNRNASFHAVDLDRMLVDRPDVVKNALHECFEWIAADAVPEIPNRVLPASEAARAFRLLANRDRIGRVTLQYEDASVEVPIDIALPEIREDRCYLITGGPGGLGLAIATHLVDEGARRLLLLSRRGAESKLARETVSKLEERGCEVRCPRVDLADREALASAIEDTREKGWQIGGVFHCALELNDRLIADTTREDIRRTFAGKVHGAWNLEELLADEPVEIWIAFSSVASLLGNPGQGVYAAANVFLEQLARHRRASGKPGTTILLGLLGDVGVARENPAVAEHLEKAGLVGMRSSEVAERLRECAAQPHPMLGFFDIDWDRWSETGAKIAEWHRFSQLCSGDSRHLSSDRFRALREELLPLDPEERRERVHEQVNELLAEILFCDPGSIGDAVPVSSLGIDSLMVVELLARFRSNLGIELGASDLHGDPSTADLVRLIEKKFELPGPGLVSREDGDEGPADSEGES